MHIPVLLNESIEGLDVGKGGIILDATLGGGGYSEQLCLLFGDSITILGIDADRDAVDRSIKRLEGRGCKFKFQVGNFSNIKNILDSLGYFEIDGVLFDLGLSSYQLESSGRGFSFQKDEPLLMTFKSDKNNDDLTAEEIVNTWSEDSLFSIISSYGEEKYARRISKAIVSQRSQDPIKTTFELAELIKESVPKGYDKGRIHPATRTFQALRIAVNDEMNALEKGIRESFEYLNPEGRIAVVSFHSLEDRVVKNIFREFENKGLAQRINKKPIIPSPEEISSNRRARSSKLRIIEKLHI